MHRPTSTRATQDETDTETWPWRCLGCGGTIYHDGEHCRDCAPAYRYRSTAGGTSRPEGFIGWMRDEPLPDYVLKVTAVAGLELGLTAVWLQVLLGGPVGIGSVLPFLP